MTLFELLQEAAQGYQHGGLRGMAEELGKGYSTLANELNPNNIERHKLGLQDAIRIMELTGDLRPLERISSRLGQVMVNIPADLPDQTDALKSLAEMAKESGEAITALSAALADGELTRAERKEIATEAWEAARAFLAVYQNLGNGGTHG